MKKLNVFCNLFFLTSIFGTISKSLVASEQALLASLSIPAYKIEFMNTQNGKAQKSKDGMKVTYTFPTKAYVVFNGKNYSLSNLQVECFGGKIDNITQEYFTHLFSKILPTNEGVDSKINTDILIIDHEYIQGPFPKSTEAQKLGIKPFTAQEYKKQVDYFMETHDTQIEEKFLKPIFDFRVQKKNELYKTLKQKIHQYLSKNPTFPQVLSIMYDDRKLQHFSHIKLRFIDFKNAELIIDDTTRYSIINNIVGKIKEFDLQNHFAQIDENEPSKFIHIYKKENINVIYCSLELSESMHEIIVQSQCERMLQVLSEVGITITQVTPHFTPHQHDTFECVSFALQNKLDFLQGVPKEYYSKNQESALKRGIRLRAEHCILSILANPMAEMIPHFDAETLHYLNFDKDIYKDELWYQNYQEIKNNLYSQFSSN